MPSAVILNMPGRGDEVSAIEDVLSDIRRRDERDSGRAVAPSEPRLKTLILLDTTELGIEAAFQAALGPRRSAF